MASVSRPAWRISLATWPTRSKPATTLLALRLQWWLDKAFGLARRLTALAASTLARKRRELEQDLDAILKAPATCDLARVL